MNLKPFRDINEHEVITLFSTVEGDLSKGSFLQMISFDPDNHSGFTTSFPNLPNGVFSSHYEVLAKVQLAQNNSGVLGLALCDVFSSTSAVASNIWTIADQRRYFDRIPSGQAVPILKRGLVSIAGFSGTAFPGAKGVVVGTASNGSGGLLVATGALANVAISGVPTLVSFPNVGTFLSKTGADGYAVFQVDCI